MIRNLTSHHCPAAVHLWTHGLTSLPIIMTQLHTRWVRCITALVTLSAAVTAQAHPGHGTTSPDSAAHLLEPVHFVTLLAVVCVAGLMGGFLLHRRRKLAKATAAARGRMSRRDDA